MQNDEYSESIIDDLLSQRSRSEHILHTWQFALGAKLADTMKNLHITTEQLANESTLTVEDIESILHTNSDPTLSTLSKISAVLGSNMLDIA